MTDMENKFFEYADYKPVYNVEQNTPKEAEFQEKPDINPRNPFNNFTEHEDYNSDYRDIVPQIDIKGCVIPYEPSKEERRQIRHYFNVTGGVLILHLLFSNFLIILMMMIFESITMKLEGIRYEDATVQYLSGLDTFFNESSIGIGLNMLVLMVCTPLAFLIGSKITKTKLGTYFNTSEGITFKAIAFYCMITFFIRYVGGFAGVMFELVFNGVDMTVGTELTTYQNLRTIAVTSVYACIVAPIIEELLYRGFVLKNLSRVSQRFGIIMSALIFGLMHQNVSQFIFGFFLGVFLAQIDIKHNSLLPSIIVHAFANTFSIIVSYSGLLDNEFTAMIAGLVMLVLAVIGTVMFFRFRKNNRLPNTMPHQAVRNGTAVSSIFLVLVIATYTGFTIINSFPSVADSFVQILG